MTAANTAPAKTEPISVTADTTKGIIYGTAEINATPEQVFRALTTPEMAEWWGQGVYRTTDYKIDLRPGGSWSCKAINPKGEESTGTRLAGWVRRGQVRLQRSPGSARLDVLAADCC